MPRTYKRIKMTCPFKEYISREEILRFDPEKPETATPVPFINAVLRTIKEEKLYVGREIGAYLCIDPRKLIATVEVLTGMSFNDFRDLIVHHEIKWLEELHPDWTKNQIAREMGYADRTTLWAVENRTRVHKNRAKIRLSRNSVGIH